jgi:hypothetical protein
MPTALHQEPCQTVAKNRFASCHGGDAFTDGASGAMHNVAAIRTARDRDLANR